MARSITIGSYRARGEVLIERLGDVTIPSLMKPSVVQFKSVNAAYQTAADAVDAAETARDEALATVSEADAVLDPSVDLLATDLIVARLSARRAPFKGFSRYSPSDMIVLAYAKEVKEVRLLVAKIKKKKPPAAVLARIKTIEAQATAVEKALRKLAVPQANYDKALRRRDALLLDWTKAEQRLRTIARAAWIDDPDTYAAVFAPIEDIQLATTRKRGATPRKSKPPEPTPEPPAEDEKAAAPQSPALAAKPAAASEATPAAAASPTAPTPTAAARPAAESKRAAVTAKSSARGKAAAAKEKKKPAGKAKKSKKGR